MTKIGIFTFFIFTSFSMPCFAQDALHKNHDFSGFQFSGDWTECSYEFSPIDFCDKKHMDAINKAIHTMAPNFNQHFILLHINERNEYFERSLVSIDTITGIVYPLPFDSYSGTMDKYGNSKNYGYLDFSLTSNKVCVNGSILAYREGDNGKLCWAFDGEKFVGHRTPYTD